MILASAALVTFLATFLPVPNQLEATGQAGPAVLAAFTMVSLGAAVLFLSSLGAFKTGFRKTYYLISAGIVTRSLSVIVFVALQYISAGLASHSGLIPLRLTGAILVYLGIRKFALILSLGGRTTSYKIIIAFAAIGIVALSVYHYLSGSTSIAVTIGHCYDWAELVLYASCIFLTTRIKAATGSQYRRPLGWFTAALTSYCIGSTLTLLNAYAHMPIAFIASVGLAYLVSYILFLVAGYSFAASTRHKQEHLVSSSTPVDIVVYTASLASQPQDVDPILDGLRIVTARMGAELGPADIEELASIYRHLEDYLITQERLRVYTRQEIRGQIRERFVVPPTLKFLDTEPMTKV